MEKGKLFTCTARFHERDFEFLSSVVASRGDQDAFRRFVADPEELLAVLDDRRVLTAMLESPSLLGVSPAFYFYVLVRHSLRNRGLESVELAEFLGAVLADRIPASRMSAGLGPRAGFVHSIDFLAMLDQVSGEMRFELLVTAGNEFLVLSGLFPEYVLERSRRRGAPDLAYYENFARSSYRQAGQHPRAFESGVSSVLGSLSEVLPEARRSLNTLADSLAFLSN